VLRLIEGFERAYSMDSMTLRCDECDKVAEGAMKGWRALLGTDALDEHEPTNTYVFCPDCAEREFGPPRKKSRLAGRPHQEHDRGTPES
jgi:hypothetical protein